MSFRVLKSITTHIDGFKMPKLTNKQLVTNEPYKSILGLFFKTGFLKGLTAADFQKEIDIKNSDTLNKCLKVLIRRKWLKTAGKPKYYRYFITPLFFAEDIKRTIKFILDLYDEDMITDYVFDMKMKENGFDNKPKIAFKKSSWELFGYTYELMGVLNPEDKKKLNNNIKNVVKNLEEIADMKLKYIKKEVIKKAEYKGDIKTLFRLHNISFYYLGTPFYYIPTPEEISLK